MKDFENFTVQDLLEIENDPRLATVTCPGTDLLLWPMVRTPFLRMVLSDYLYEAPIPGAQTSPKLERIKGFAQAAVSNVIKSDIKGSVLIRVTAQRGHKKDGKPFHWLADYLVDELPGRTTVLEDLGGRAIPKDRYNDRVLYHDPVLIRADLMSRRHQKQHMQAASDLVDMVANNALKSLGWKLSQERRSSFVKLVARYIARAPFLLGSYKAMLQKLNTELVIIEEACYGNSMICLTAAARSLGLVTAEIQHGLISRGHDAYNLPPALSQDATYRKMLPDYILTYGDWWGTQLSVPVSPFTLGNPHGNTAREEPRSGPSGNANILILGNGIETDKYIAFCRNLSDALPEHKIKFRPHPLERQYCHETFPSDGFGNVSIDVRSDIYVSLSDANVVAGEISTGLFEALGITPRILLWTTAKARFHLPQHPFESFDDLDGLVEALRSTETPNVAWTASDVWAPDWRTNYRNFLGHVNIA